MRRPYTPAPSIPTVEPLRRARERLSRLRREIFSVLRAMKRGAALRLYPGDKSKWALTTGQPVTAAAAKVVIVHARVAAVDFSLLAEVPAQTWRWVGSDLFTVNQKGD
jgi:hypothetical protein